MRLKCYTAETMAEAMQMIREELGDDAIIISTQRGSGGKGVRITAALEMRVEDDDDVIQEALTGIAPSRTMDAVREALTFHGTPPSLIERLMTAAPPLNGQSPTEAIIAALDAGFNFAPLPERSSPRPFLLIGPPGAGKTVTVAKLAARARLKGRSVTVITADTVRAGAVEQLSAFTSILDVDLMRVRGPEALSTALDELVGASDLVFIDSPSVNPFHQPDLSYLISLVESWDIEPILVMAAGGDANEGAEMAEAFAAASPTRLFVTRLDLTRRLGSLLAAANAGDLMFCDVSVNPHVATGLFPINASALAQLLLPDAADVYLEQEPRTEAHP